MDSSKQQQFAKEFSKAVTYSMLERLTGKIENDVKKRHVNRTIENLQSKVNKILTPENIEGK